MDVFDEPKNLAFGIEVLEELVDNAVVQLDVAEKTGDIKDIAYFQGIKDGLRMLAAALNILDHRGSSGDSQGRYARPDAWAEVVMINPRAKQSWEKNT